MLTPEQIALIRAISLENDIGLTLGGDSVVAPPPPPQENLVVQVEPGHLNPTGEVEFNATREQLNDMIAAAVASGGLWNTAYGGGGGNVDMESVGGGSWGGGANVGTAPGAGARSGYGPGTYTHTAPAVSDGPMVNTGIGTASQNEATPWADAYARASERSRAKGPISGLFAKELEK